MAITSGEEPDRPDGVAIPAGDDLAEWWQLVLSHERMLLGTQAAVRAWPATAERRAEVQRRMHMPYHRLVRGSPDAGYLAIVLEMPGCRVHGRTAVEAFAQLETAMADWLESRLRVGVALPEPAPALEPLRS